MAAGNSTFTTFFTSTLRNYRPKLIENLMGQQALFWQLRSRGFVEEQSGSRSIVQPLMYGQNSTVGSYSGWDLLDLTPQEGITAAEFDWKFLSGSVVMSGEEEFKNSGSKTRIFNLLDAKIRQLEISFKMELNSQLYGDGTGNGGKDITGLGLGVEDGTAWSTYGGIDSSDADNSWWRNQWIDFDTFSGGVSTFLTADGGSCMGVSAMRNMYNNCTLQNSKPTLIITTQLLYEAYEAWNEGNKQRLPFTGGAKAMADAGFTVLSFKGVPIIFDEDLEAEEMLFLNSEYIKFVIGSGRNFVQKPFQTPPNQDGKSSVTLFAGNLVMSKRDQHGRISDMTP